MSLSQGVFINLFQIDSLIHQLIISFVIQYIARTFRGLFNLIVIINI